MKGCVLGAALSLLTMTAAAYAQSPAAPAGRRSCRFKSIGQRLVAWAKTCVDQWEAAAMYEQLSALSDVELGRRGLSRAGLAQNVHDAVERCQ